MEIGLFVAPQEGASYDDQLRAAVAAERHGFDAFVRSDHYLGFGGARLPGPTDSWVTLAGLARETERIQLGTMVSSATFRLPGPLAIAVAQVDVMSGGRVLLGLGAGWSEPEHLAYGIRYPPLGERFDRLEEQLQIVLGLWTTPVGETFDFAGRHYQLDASPALPKPMQRPHPPVVVGGTGPRRTPALAARYADEFNLPPFQSRRGDRDGVRARPGGVRMRSDATRARSRSRSRSRRSAVRTREQIEHRGAVSPAQYEAADLVGLPSQIADQLDEYADLGASRAYLRVLDLRDVEHIELLGSQVLPSYHVSNV